MVYVATHIRLWRCASDTSVDVKGECRSESDKSSFLVSLLHSTPASGIVGFDFSNSVILHSSKT